MGGESYYTCYNMLTLGICYMKRFGANGRLVDDSLEDSVGKWLPTAKEKGEGDMAAHWVLGFLYIMTMFCSSVITVAKYCEMYSKLPNYML